MSRRAEHGDPYVATKKSRCGDPFCRVEITRGDVVYSPSMGGRESTLPWHIAHLLKYLDDDIARLTVRGDRAERVAFAVLQFCSALSAVSADWVSDRYRDLGISSSR